MIVISNISLQIDGATVLKIQRAVLVPAPQIEHCSARMGAKKGNQNDQLQLKQLPYEKRLQHLGIFEKASTRRSMMVVSSNI